MSDVQVPTVATLRKYGLSEERWREMLEEQGGACALCELVPSSGRLVIDHEHVTGWKRMPPERRVLFVRGLLCAYCNMYVLWRGATYEVARNVYLYFKRYMDRRPETPKPRKPVRGSKGEFHVGRTAHRERFKQRGEE